MQNRVSTILGMVQWTLALGDTDPLPLYHVDGEENIADLLTKKHSISAQVFNFFRHIFVTDMIMTRSLKTLV